MLLLFDSHGGFRVPEEVSEIESAVVNGRYLLIIKPQDALAIFPKPMFLLARRASPRRITLLRHSIDADPKLFALDPVAFILPAIRPNINAESVLLIIPIKTFIRSAVIPGIQSHAFHVILQPFSFIFTVIQPSINSCAVYFVRFPFSCILRTIVPGISA